MSVLRFKTFRHITAAFLSASAILFSAVPAWAETNPGQLEEENAEASAALSAQISEQGQEDFERYQETGDPNDLQAPSDTASPSLHGLASPEVLQDLPSSFDLRESGTVTPVKNQMDWNICWSFGTIAASESSILTDLGKTFADYPLDLSELQLAWMTMTSPDPTKNDLNGQDGEGYVIDSANSTKVLFSESNVTAAAHAIEAGSGPVTESEVPYQSKEGYTSTYGNSGYWYYQAAGDWSVSEDYRFKSIYPLSETRVIPSGTTSGQNAIKNEIRSGHPVDIGCYLRQNDTIYYNPDTSSAYCDRAISNHEVCIVGWDDSYSRENFNENIRPSGDGAWLVKNSWGSELSAPPNQNAFGIRDADGAQTGYFWISYEDQSLTDAVSFYYDVTSDQNSQECTEQYNYLNAPATMNLSENEETSIANIFTADETSDITAVSCETLSGGTTVTYEIYRLNAGYTTPTDGTRIASLSRTYPYAGFHRESIGSDAEALVKKGDSVSIVVSIRAADGSYEVPLPYGWNQEFTEQHNANYPASPLTGYYNGVVNPGESFVSGGDSWNDLTSVISQVRSSAGSYYTYDNLPLRIYLTPSDPTEDAQDSGPGDTDPAVTPAADSSLHGSTSADPSDTGSTTADPSDTGSTTADPSGADSTAANPSDSPAAPSGIADAAAQSDPTASAPASAENGSIESSTTDRGTENSDAASSAAFRTSAASGAKTGDTSRTITLTLLFIAAVITALILIHARRISTKHR